MMISRLLVAVASFPILVSPWSRWSWTDQRELVRPPRDDLEDCVLGADGDWSTITGTGEEDCVLNALGAREKIDPGARRGHTLTLRPESNELILFGGRGNDGFQEHRPKTYEIKEVKGKLEFTSYEDRFVTPETEECAAARRESNDTASLPPGCDTEVPIGTFYNDIWSYDIGCLRYAAQGCEAGRPWTTVDPGAPLGGCKLETGGKEVCSHPTERYGHTSAMVNGVLVVFGGFSQFCEDYCQDTWGYYFDAPVYKDSIGSDAVKWRELVQKDNSIAFGQGPGKRWRLASVVAETRIFLFGGHRLWHGFDNMNSFDNKYAEVAELEKYADLPKLEGGSWRESGPNPSGGYLDDLWEWDIASCVGTAIVKNPFGKIAFDAAMQAEDFHSTFKLEPCTTENAADGTPAQVAWKKRPRIKQCADLATDKDGNLKPGYKWEERGDVVCEVRWPPARAGHAMVVSGNKIFVHGGYRTFLPYPNTHSYGAGKKLSKGTNAQLRHKQLSPYPTYPFYLADLWEYTIVDDPADPTYPGVWREIPAVGAARDGAVPSPRMEHTMIVTGHTLVVFGGYRGNFHMNDLWYFNMSRAGNRGTGKWLEKRSFVEAVYPDSCVEGGWVLGWPTRYDREGRWIEDPTQLEPGGGRAEAHFYINFTRRQAPGWDGCRERADGDSTLKQELMWQKPSQRSNHAALYAELDGPVGTGKEGLMLVYGGHGYLKEFEDNQYNKTNVVRTKGDLWQLRISGHSACPKNCSGRGTCEFGYCFCDDGYYGIDCSNISCPGDFCYYDPDTNEQICRHCCSAPYIHTDDDVYRPDERKIPCDHNHPGELNGICDGNGTCQCRPPFITDDCSVKDCKNNCSSHGWCSVEYPVSRCICDYGYRGEDCSERMCLNDCSAPNGECVNGECVCIDILNPYNRYKPWVLRMAPFGPEDRKVIKYEGIDCSYVTPFAAGCSPAPALVLWGAIMVFEWWLRARLLA